MTAWFDAAGRTPPAAAAGMLHRVACANDALHVWSVGPDAADAMHAWLTEAERLRAQRLAAATHRRMFVAARGALRLLLGHYLHRDALGLPLTIGPRGKPGLAGAAPLAFNVTHCDDLALIALAGAGAVGVDVERADRKVDVEPLARRCLSEAERRILEARPPAQRAPLFMRYWTRKEAVAKALGVGLAIDFRSIEVDIDAVEQRVALDSASGRVEVELIGVCVDAGYLAAVAWCARPDPGAA
jgi:4'-phosphopantetheinyl transferase